MITRMLKLAVVSLLGLFAAINTSYSQSVLEVAAEVDRLLDQQTQPSSNNLCNDCLLYTSPSPRDRG